MMERSSDRGSIPLSSIFLKCSIYKGCRVCGSFTTHFTTQIQELTIFQNDGMYMHSGSEYVRKLPVAAFMHVLSK